MLSDENIFLYVLRVSIPITILAVLFTNIALMPLRLIIKTLKVEEQTIQFKTPSKIQPFIQIN